MHQSKGSIVVDEIVMPIQDMYLKDRRIFFEAKIRAPVAAGRTTSYTVHDQQGSEVMRALDINGLVWDDVGPFDHLIVVASLAIQDFTARGLTPALTGDAALPWPEYECHAGDQ